MNSYCDSLFLHSRHYLSPFVDFRAAKSDGCESRVQLWHREIILNEWYFQQKRRLLSILTFPSAAWFRAPLRQKWPALSVWRNWELGRPFCLYSSDAWKGFVKSQPSPDKTLKRLLRCRLIWFVRLNLDVVNYSSCLVNFEHWELDSQMFKPPLWPCSCFYLWLNTVFSLGFRSLDEGHDCG